MNFKYTLKSDGTVEYTGPDNKMQNLSGRDISSKEALEADLSEYTRAYMAGLEIEQAGKTAGDGLTVGKAVTAEVTESAEAPQEPVEA